MAIPGEFVAGTALTAASMNQLPAGLVGLAATASPQVSIGTSATALTGFSVAVATVANRRYKITVHVPVRQRTSSGAVTLEVCKAGTTVVNAAWMSLGTDEYGTFDVSVIEKPGAGTTTYTARLRTTANTCEARSGDNSSTGLIFVEDLGII